MSYSLIFHCLLAVAITKLTYDKIIELRNRRHVKKVWFSDSASGCCGEANCPNPKCFAKNLKEITTLIDESQHSICMALYTFNLDSVRESLISAKRRGVQVRIITTTKTMTDLSKDLTRLSNSGVNIRFPKIQADNLLHHKFCIIDGKNRDPTKPIPEKATLLTGSMNWTMSSFTSNWDNIIVTSEKKFISRYQKEFDSLWESFRSANR